METDVRSLPGELLHILASSMQPIPGDVIWVSATFFFYFENNIKYLVLVLKFVFMSFPELNLNVSTEIKGEMFVMINPFRDLHGFTLFHLPGYAPPRGLFSRGGAAARA